MKHKSMTSAKVDIIGAGLAGTEAAWQLAESGLKVRLFEMKPKKYTSAHKSEGFAELVCSNSLRSNDPVNAAGLLKEEMRKLNSLVIHAADETAVPAGKALAVDRELFSELITEKIKSHKFIEVIHEEFVSLHSPPAEQDNLPYTIIASGPLTSEPLSKEISKLIGGDHLYFYDSVAPIVDSDSIDFSKGYKASRYGYGGDDYWNFPLTEKEYHEFLSDLLTSEKVTPRKFEDPKYFEGCLPIEIMAERGPDTLRHGPMKPFGLKEPKTNKEPYAVVQLRLEDRKRSMMGLVGFQTRMTWPEQKRIFSKIPGLENAKFIRYGVIHRNTYINSPGRLDENLELIEKRKILFAGQLTGVEGYIESAATGLWCGIYLSNLLNDKKIVPPPKTTAIGSLIWHVVNPNHRNFQPMNVNFGLMPIIKEKIPKKFRKKATAERAENDFARWFQAL